MAAPQVVVKDPVAHRTAVLQAAVTDLAAAAGLAAAVDLAADQTSCSERFDSPRTTRASHV
jgi:hypothetical protein